MGQRPQLPQHPPSLSPSLSVSHPLDIGPSVGGMSTGKKWDNLCSPIFDVAGIKAHPQPGKLRGHLSAPVISPMAGLSVMVRLVPLPGAQGYKWDERLG